MEDWAQCFCDIDYALNNKHETGRLTPTQIDQYVSYLTPVQANSTLVAQHTELLREMAVACKKHKLKLEQIVVPSTRGRDTMHFKDLELIVVNSMRLTWTLNWRKFLASKYCEVADLNYDKIKTAALARDVTDQVKLIGARGKTPEELREADGKALKPH